MKTKSIFKIALLVASLFCSFTTSAADPQIVLNSHPDGAEVYMNGELICASTPAIVTISGKNAGKTLLFQFKKEGYESKTLTRSYSKKELKNKPLLSVQMKKIEERSDDPGIRKGHQNERVNRDNAGSTDMEKSIIRWYFDSDPRGARIFWRVISSVPNEVKNTNETYLTTTPYEETRGFNIQGLTYNNSRDVTIEIKLTKRGYEDQVKRFNARQCLDQQEISGFFELIEKDDQPTTTKKKKKKVVIEEEDDDE